MSLACLASRHIDRFSATPLFCGRAPVLAKRATRLAQDECPGKRGPIIPRICNDRDPQDGVAQTIAVHPEREDHPVPKHPLNAGLTQTLGDVSELLIPGFVDVPEAQRQSSDSAMSP